MYFTLLLVWAYRLWVLLMEPNPYFQSRLGFLLCRRPRQPSAALLYGFLCILFRKKILLTGIIKVMFK